VQIPTKLDDYLTVIGVQRVITIHFKFGKSDDGDYDTKLAGRSRCSETLVRHRMPSFPRYGAGPQHNITPNSQIILNNSVTKKNNKLT